MIFQILVLKKRSWGSVLQLEYEKAGKEEKFQYSIAQDWVKYPAKEPTKYMKVIGNLLCNILKTDKNLRSKIG